MAAASLRRTRTRTAVAGGLLDSGFAALAAFASSIYASRVFEIGLLGYYSVFLTAFVASSNIPGRLLFFPYEIAAAGRPDHRRLAYVKTGLIRATPLAVVSAAGFSLVAGLITQEAGFPVVLGLGGSMAIAASLSPLQDFVRRMLHLGHRSGKAVLVSALQLAGVLVFLFVFDAMGIDQVWIPYLALAGANAASLLLGVFLVGSVNQGIAEEPPRFKAMARSAWWLLYISLPGPALGLVVNAIVLNLADAVALGFAEAARQVARPLLVVTTGLGMSLRPRSFAAAQRKQRSAARRLEWIFIATTLAAGLVYTTLVSLDWPGNVMSLLIPKAFETDGLVVAVCLANIALGVAFPSGYELVGAGRERYAALVESLAQVPRTAVAGFASLLGAFTIAASEMVLGVSRFVGYRHGLRQIYGDAPNRAPQD